MKDMKRGALLLRSWSCNVARSGAAAIITTAIGCVPQSQFQPKVDDEGRFLVHVVDTPGQKISALCRWYSGRRDCENVIKEENSFIALDDLQPGDRVYFPFSVVTRVEAYQPGAAAKQTTSAAVGNGDPIAAPTDDTFDLTGRTEAQPQEQVAAPALDPLEEVMSRNEAAAKRQPPPPLNETDGIQSTPDARGLETFELQDEAEMQPPNAAPAHSDLSSE